MPPSDSAASDSLLAAVEYELGALETLCGRLESAFRHRDWPQIAAALAESRRVTHALRNAMDDAQGARGDVVDREIFRRLRAIYAVRENQLTRLRQFNEAVGARLQTLVRWKAALRSMPKTAQSGRLGTLDQIR